MFDTTEELVKQIDLGEDLSLGLKDLRYKGERVNEPHRDAMADELAAMANTASGVFVLGVDDKSKAVAGIPKDKLDIVETWLRDICNDVINPPLFCRIRKIPVPINADQQKAIIRIDVPRSLHVHESPGGYFHRVGSSKRKMTPDVLARLFEQRSHARMIRFDEKSVAMAPKSCLDKDLWGKFKTKFSPDDDEEFLTKLHLLKQDEDGNICPTIGGILLACNTPHEYLLNAYIQAVAYRGTERNAAYQLDARDIVGPLDTQILEAYKFVEKNMRVYAVKQPARRDIPQYDLKAVFEAIVNAIAHRDYSIHGSKIRLHMYADRLEIYSPGNISNTMTVDSMAMRQSARNELLASLLARCPLPDEIQSDRAFLMDRRGEGVPAILSKSLGLSGNLPEYLLIDNAELKLTIFAAEPPKIED